MDSSFIRRILGRVSFLTAHACLHGLYVKKSYASTSVVRDDSCRYVIDAVGVQADDGDRFLYRLMVMPFQDAFIHKVMEFCDSELEASSQMRGEFISRNPLLGACELHRHDIMLVGDFIRSATITLVRSFLH